MKAKFLFLIIFLFFPNLIFFAACKREPLSSQEKRETFSQPVKVQDKTKEEREAGNRMRKRQGWRWQGQAISLSAAEKEAVKVEIFKVTRQNVRPYLSAVGNILAPYTKMSVISYAFPARVVTIHGQIGEWVKKGAPLLTLQSEEVGRAKADFFKARADFELAARNYERQKRLFERGAGAQKDLLAAEAEFKVAEANHNAMEKRLHVLGFSEEEVKLIAERHQINPVITLFSPISGKIVEIKVVLGEMVDQSKEIMTILDPTILWVDAEIFERDLAKIKIGQDAEISVQAYPEKVFSGKISYVGDVLKEATRTVTVRTEVVNQGFLLKPGMFATTKIFLQEEKSVLVVPKEAILDDQGEKFVFVRKGNAFEPTKVVVGAEQNNFYEILSGLEEGMEVVSQGSYELKSKLYQEELKKAGLH